MSKYFSCLSLKDKSHANTMIKVMYMLKIDRLLGYKNIFWSIIYKFKQSSERLMSFDECISGLDLPEE